MTSELDARGGRRSRHLVCVPLAYRFSEVLSCAFPVLPFPLIGPCRDERLDDLNVPMLSGVPERSPPELQMSLG